MPSVVIKPLQPDEIAELVSWASGEGWNPGLEDAKAFAAADPGGFLGCFVDGTFAAGISAVRYGTDFGFIGLYICKPEHRGKGYGRRVWDAGMALLEGRTTGLDGVPEQQANYRSMGFEPVYDTVRWSGTQAVTTLSGRTKAVGSERIENAVIAFDRAYFPGPRAEFLHLWLNKPHLVRTVHPHGKLAGYGVLRECLDGFKIGPLFAHDAGIAKALLNDLTVDSAGGTIHIDVPALQTGFSSFLEQIGFSAGFTTARMYRGPVPDIDLSGVFGVSTLELG